MRALVGVFAVLLSLCTPKLGLSSEVPYSEESSARFAALEGQILPQKAMAVARVVWDCSGNSSVCVAGTYGTGVYLPKDAIVMRSYFYTPTTPTGYDTSSTIALQCEDSGNILAANGFQPFLAGSIVAGKQNTGLSTVAGQRLSSAFPVTALAARCQLSYVVAGTTLTAGKIVGFVEYVIAQ